MVQTTFGVSLSVYFTIANMIADSFIANQLPFFVYSPAFTVPYGTAIKADLITAQNMPDKTARRATNRAIRSQLEKLNEKMCRQFRALKGYILTAFPTTTDTEYDLAGKDYYDKAADFDRESTLQMGAMMETYITANSVALLANNNMPPTFLADFLLLKAAFIAKQDEYMQARQNAPLAGDAKRAAFNAIDVKIKAICKAAQLLGFSETLLKEFNFSHLEKMVSGAGNAKLNIYITSFATNLPIHNATIKVKNIDPTLCITAHTNPKGIFTLSTPAGWYYLEITAPNPTTGNPYLWQIQLAILKIGTKSTIHIQMLQLP